MSNPYYRNLGGKPPIRKAQEQTRVVSGPYITVSTAFLYYFQQHTFTNCGQTGYTGPTLSMCKSTYSSQPWVANSNFFNMTTQGIQLWTVPATGVYRIEAYGARGGGNDSNAYGWGAVISGNVNLTQNAVLKILVGQIGLQYNPVYSGGGGGGTFIATLNNQPIIIAGGGGGQYYQGNSRYNAHASLNENGQSTGCNGGSGGTGGQASWAAGGAGFTGNGAAGSYSQVVAQAFINGGNGGQSAYYPGSPAHGGFGGGGCTHGNNGHGGGGGGYSGGGGGYSSPYAGGGGGSYYRNATNVSTSVGNTGHGQVIITRVS